MAIVAPQDAETPLVLALDVGSSSTRALLFDRRGREIAGCVARQQYAVHTTADGGVEDDADAALTRIVQCIDGALAQAGPLVAQIAAVAVTTYVSNLLGVAAGARPLTPVYLYADTRSAAAAAALRTRLDEAAILDRTGCPLRTAYLPARLRWLQHVQPQLVRQVSRWITLGEYLELRLFGQCRVSYSVASWSGLLDRRALTWDGPLLAEIGLDAGRLSPLVDAQQPLSGLSAPYAQRWPALAHIPWFPAIGDGAAANLGSGCADPTRIALTVGTTGALRAVVPDEQRTASHPNSQSPIPMGLWCYRVDARRALLGGATSEGGNVFVWLKRVLRLGDAALIEAALAAGEPDGHGLTVLPFLAGERSPGWAAAARAEIGGLRLATTAEDILRAGLEAVTYRFALIAGLLEAALPGVQAFVASGGALLASPAWTQIIADTLGRPLYASAIDEPSGRGAALLALEALGLLDEIAALPLEYSHIYEPDPARHARYAAAIARQQALYERLIAPEEHE